MLKTKEVIDLLKGREDVAIVEANRNGVSNVVIGLSNAKPFTIIVSPMKKEDSIWQQ